MPCQGEGRWPHLAQDDLDLRFKTHVQHSICLVQHKIGDTLEVGNPGIQHVYEPAGSGNHYFCPLPQVSNLRTLGNSSVYAGILDLGAGPKLGALLLYLDGQLSGGSQYKSDWAISLFCTDDSKSDQESPAKWS